MSSLRVRQGRIASLIAALPAHKMNEVGRAVAFAVDLWPVADET